MSKIIPGMAINMAYNEIKFDEHMKHLGEKARQRRDFDVDMVADKIIAELGGVTDE